tara:strand:- start:2391 stop:3836 length:1446 start_codon:yes stop_codon:yes gene_type:complete
MIKKSVIPVILCGGSGTRLWPLSRESFPKQFLSLQPEDSKSLLQKTQERISNVNYIKNPILICNEEHRFIVAEQMREINIKPSAILLEPFGKNTEPAITIASLKALELDQDPVLLVLSSDHEIKDEEEFLKVIEAGIEKASEGKLVTFGVIPTAPETGYGYIKSKENVELSPIKGSEIDSFIEKPDKETAKKLLKDKKYTWNSGIFLFKAKAILKEICKYNPEVISICKDALKDNYLDLDFQRLNIDIFSKCPNLSIDIGVMEKTSLGFILPLNVGWSDIGSWDALWEISKKDDEGNFTEGNIYQKNNTNCYLRGEKRLIAAIGLKNVIVVETSDAILIATKEHSQKIKNIVNELKAKKFSEGQNHKKVFRPWGYYESIIDDKRWQVKLINVKSGEKLSLQLHHHRSEHWVVVNGTAKVEIDNKEFILHENQSSYIPIGSKHRLSNPGQIPLKLIEIQSGSYLGEDDIQRFDDNYGRVTKL